MEIVSIQQAEMQLATLVARALAGEEVIIECDDGPAVRLVPIGEAAAHRQRGQWRGRIRIADDFDDWPEDVARAFGIGLP